MADEKSLDNYAERSQMKSEANSSSNSNTSSNTSSPRRGSSRESRGGYRRCHNRDRTDRNRSINEGQHLRRTSTPSDGAQATVSSISERTTEVDNSEGPSTSSQQNKKNKSSQGKKRVSPKTDLEIRSNDVFVNDNTHFLAQLAKCQRLFDKGHREIFLHGLGKSIPRALNLAFELVKFYRNTVAYAVNTSTVEFIDDIVDLENPEQSPTHTVQKVSSIDIRVYRCVDIP